MKYDKGYLLRWLARTKQAVKFDIWRVYGRTKVKVGDQSQTPGAKFVRYWKNPENLFAWSIFGV